MIISVEKARELVKFDDTWTDARIEMKLKAIEQTIRAYTNNNFQNRECRRVTDIIGDSFTCEALTPFDVGDTVQISESKLNRGLYVISSADDATFTVNESVKDEKDILVTKIEYPADGIDACVNLLSWEVDYRGKTGIKSETLSRHSVTYFDLNESNQIMGYPAPLLGCLKPYRKCRC